MIYLISVILIFALIYLYSRPDKEDEFRAIEDWNNAMKGMRDGQKK